MQASSKQFAISLIWYAVLLTGLYTLFIFLELIHFWPKKDNVVFWDADWYNSIKVQGYYYSDQGQTNSAFFPLFSYFWRLLHLSNIGICIFNFLLFAGALLMLVRQFSIPVPTAMIFVSLPSCIFFMLPFSESRFFFCCSLFMTGLKKENHYLIITGLLFASLTRATAMFFIPSILVMELFYCRTLLSKKYFYHTLLFSAISVAGILIVVFIQHYQVGVYWAFAKQQVQFWGHKFSLPVFPLAAWDDARIMWLDCLALLSGLFALLIVCILFVDSFLKKTNRYIELYSNRPYIFSLMFCVMTMVYVLFFNTKYGNGHTGTNSFHRYMFATPFYLVFFFYSLKTFVINKRNVILFSVVMTTGFILCGLGHEFPWLTRLFHSHLRTTVYFFFIYIYALLLFSMGREYFYKREVSACLFVINIILQISLINDFIQHKWVA